MFRESLVGFLNPSIVCDTRKKKINIPPAFQSPLIDMLQTMACDTGVPPLDVVVITVDRWRFLILLADNFHVRFL